MRRIVGKVERASYLRKKCESRSDFNVFLKSKPISASELISIDFSAREAPM